MRVKEKLTPYIRRIYQAYLFKIGLLSMSAVLMALLLIEVLSKFISIVDVSFYQFGVSGVTLILTCLLGWIKRPEKVGIYRQIDQLGFENRVTTYLEYSGSDNPFTDYLEEDLLRSLEGDDYKQIKRVPHVYYFVTVLGIALLFGGVSLWQTEISLKSDAIAEDILAIEDQALALEEELKEEIKDLETLKLAEEEMNESLEEIKDNIREQNRTLAEQNLFKMEESLDRKLTGEGLPEAVDGIMEGIKEVALGEDGPTLLATLAGTPSQSKLALSDAQLSEGTSTDNPPADGESASNQSSENSNESGENNGQAGDGT